MTLTAFCTLTASAAATFVSIQAQQRYPWNGLVDITVVFEGSADDVAATECAFAATNKATKAALTIVSVAQNGPDAGSGTSWTRKYLWDAATDVGKIVIRDVALTLTTVASVQLWENGPYWATCNLGSTKPEDMGWHCRWGDTVGYKRNAANNGWISTDGKDTAFSFESTGLPTWQKSPTELLDGGYVDANYNLVSAYDVATATLHVSWRMPTSAEINGLINNCTKTWTNDYNGTAGYIVKGKGTYASRSIFLPVAGYGQSSSLSNAGTTGCYWSATPLGGNTLSSYYLEFTNNKFVSTNDRRFLGRSVRPVRKPVQ